MTVTNYLMKQNICSVCDVSPTPSITLTAENIDYPLGYDGDKVQQFILQSSNDQYFIAQNCYYIKLQIPQDQNYDLHYGIRLMNITDTQKNNGISLKDSVNYQFVKYISIPRFNPNNINSSTVWLYQIDSIINAAVAKPLSELPASAEERANKIFYDNNNHIVNIYDSSGNLRRYNNNTNFYDKIGEPLTTQMANNFTNNSNTEPINREFLIIPEQNCNAIYLYLKPISDDSSITWKDTNNNIMMGRYIKDISEIIGQCEQITRNEVEGLSNIVNFAVWGRSEQLMAINGQELKIGPSGYFELKNYDIDSLYIINSAPDDKYTVDIQYQSA